MADNEAKIVVSADTSGAQSSLNELSNSVNEFAGNINESLDQIKEFGESLVEAFALNEVKDGLEELIGHFGELAESLDRTAQMTGLSTEQIQQFNFAVVSTGGNVDGAQQALIRLQKNIEDASTGTGKAADAFKALGVNVLDSDGKIRPLNDILGDVAEAFHNSEDGITKTTIALDIGGRSFAQMIPLLNQGKEGLNSFNTELDKTSSVLTPAQVEAFDHLEKSTKTLGAAFDGLKLSIASAFSSTAQSGIDYLTAKTEELTNAINTARKAWNQPSVGPNFVGPIPPPSIMMDQYHENDPYYSHSEGGSPGHGQGTKGEQPKKELTLPKTSSTAGNASDNSDDVDLDSLEDELTKQSEKIDAQRVQQKKIMLEGSVKDEQAANQESLANDQITNEQYLQNKLKLQQQLDAIDMQALEEKKAADAGDLLREAQDDTAILALKQKQAAAEEAISQQIVQAETKDQQQLASQINTSFSSAVDSVVTGSKTMMQAFTSFANSVIEDIVKIEEKDLIASIFGAGTGANGSGGGIGGTIAGLFGSATSSVSAIGSNLTSAASSVSGLASGINFGGFRASGGDVSAGQGYVVGENGPEFFLPGQGGSVLNQGQMSKMASNNYNVNMNVSSPNASSFRQNTGQMMADVSAAIRRSAARNT